MNRPVAGLPIWRTGDWERTRWWRVIRNDTIWCETSDEDEARASMGPGDTLERLWRRESITWRPVTEP